MSSVEPDARETFAGPDPPTTPGSVECRRESIRRHFLRANTAVATVLVAVLALAVAAVLASMRATRHQRLAEQAQAVARTELWNTYLSQARAARLGSALGRRQESLRALAGAAEIRSSAELRDEAIAALALPDFVQEQAWPLSEETATEAFDHDLRQYAVGLTTGDIFVHRVADNQIQRRLRQSDGEVSSAQGPVLGLEFSPDGERLAARYQRGGAVVWELASGKVIFRQAVDKPRGPLSRPRFTSDGRYLVCMTLVPREGVGVFDLTTGQSVAHFPFRAGMHATPRPGTTMFSVNTETNFVLVLDWRTGQTVAGLEFPAAISRTAWSQDGKYLAIAGNTVEVHLWDMETQQKRVLGGHTAEVRHLTFDPTGAWLASASWDATTRIWEIRSGRLLGMTEEGFAQQFGPNGRLALTRFKGAAEIWSVRPSPVHRLQVGPGHPDASVWASDLSSDGRWMASMIAEQGVAIWDLDGGRDPAWFDLPGLRMLSFHPERPELYLASTGGVSVRTLTVDTTKIPPELKLGEPTVLALPTNFGPNWITHSRDGRKMAFASFYDGRTFITNVGMPDQVVWPKGLRHVIRSGAQNPAASGTGGGTMALSGDGRWVACGFVYPMGTKVWDAQSGELVATLSSENSVVEFSPDDRWLAAGDRAHYELFRVGDWHRRWQMPRDGALLLAGSCAFSPDSQQLAVAKSPQTAAILDVASGRELAQLTSPRAASIQVIRWSPDGRRVVFGTGENLIQVWKMDTLRTNLAALGLKMDGATIAAAGVPPAWTLDSPTGSAGALVFGLVAAGVVTLIALLALRRHRGLIEDFARSEALATQRQRELQVEREVGRLKSTFVSMVSHEFRTPLGVITASAGNLQRYFARLSEEQRAQLLGDIARSSSRMTDLIEEVLLLGKVESGKMQCQPASVDLLAFCRRIVGEVRASAPNGCAIELTAPEPFEEAHLDVTLAGIILTNLLSNAVKYSPNGISARLSVRREGREAIFEVRDQGIGIPQADQANLFKSFHRGRNVATIPGSGLGLTIVKRCSDLHGGTVSFISVEGKGTTFTVRLPIFADSNSTQHDGAR